MKSAGEIEEAGSEDEDAELLVSWFSRADVEGLRRASGFHWPWKARYWELPPFDATTPPLKPENL